MIGAATDDEGRRPASLASTREVSGGGLEKIPSKKIGGRKIEQTREWKRFRSCSLFFLIFLPWIFLPGGPPRESQFGELAVRGWSVVARRLLQ
jgi:hypothetical protein